MPKSLKTISSHVSDIVDARRRTKDARFKELPPDVERVESVLQGAVAYLGERLVHLGFKASLSQLSLSRRAGKLTQVIQVRAAGGNLSGASVEISVEAFVRSADFKRWTESHGRKYAREHLWIQQLGYLSGSMEYFKWQLVDASTRSAELQDLLAKIQTLALPAFEAWGTIEAIGSAVFRMTELDRLDWLMEAALWSDNPQSASELVRRHLRSHPQEALEYSTELAKFQANPLAAAPTPHPLSGAAYLVSLHKLRVANDG